MSAQPEEFEQLQKLLKLKRYEQPPPRYFNEFSSRVISRIQDEAGAGAQESSWLEAPWLKRFFQFLERSPLAAGSFAASVCALLVGGIVYSEYTDRGGGDMAISDGNPQLADLRLPFKRDQIPLSSTNAHFGGMGAGVFGVNVSATPVSFTPSVVP